MSPVLFNKHNKKLMEKVFRDTHRTIIWGYDMKTVRYADNIAILVTNEEVFKSAVVCGSDCSMYECFY